MARFTDANAALAKEMIARVRQKVAPDRWANTGIEAQAKVDAR